MVTVVAGAGKGGVIFLDAGTVLCWGGTYGTFIWVRYVCHVPVHCEYDGRLPPQGVTQVDGAESKEGDIWDIGLNPTGRGNIGGRHKGCVDLRRPPPEYGHTIHYNRDHYGPVSGGGATPGDKYV